MVSLVAFVDELEKIAIELNKHEKRNQALQFGALGSIAGPAIASATHKIEHGTWLPAANKNRWLGARLVGGVLTAGALPIIRHHIERGNLEAARERSRAAQRKL